MYSPDYVSVSEAARILGSCPETVRRLVKRRKLSALALGRVYRVELASIGSLMVGAEAGDERTTVHA